VHIYAGFIRKAGYITKMAVPPTHKRLHAFENTGEENGCKKKDSNRNMA
jgi:hypothetical protein